ncbi:MAG TPA: response regulator [Burkholderiaceae bacterium]|jgi:FixJ family two-component response regulator|nr:response regulator [Burkholderiaceae bacterium]
MDTNRSSVTIHIVDDDDALRTALARLLGAAGFGVAVHASADSFLAAPPAPGPGVILLDVHMPGLSGLQLQDYLVGIRHPLPIVFLSGGANIAMSVRAIKAGAEDFLSKPVSSEALFEAVERAVVRYRGAAVSMAELDALHTRMQTLTPREQQVFGLVVQGLLNKQIADQLGNTERTVKEHRRSVMEKMQVDSLAELVMAASRLGVLKNA